jgi:hypothetical protein
MKFNDHRRAFYNMPPETEIEDPPELPDDGIEIDDPELDDEPTPETER